MRKRGWLTSVVTLTSSLPLVLPNSCSSLYPDLPRSLPQPKPSPSPRNSLLLPEYTPEFGAEKSRKPRCLFSALLGPIPGLKAA